MKNFISLSLMSALLLPLMGAKQTVFLGQNQSTIIRTQIAFDSNVGYSVSIPFPIGIKSGDFIVLQLTTNGVPNGITQNSGGCAWTTVFTQSANYGNNAIYSCVLTSVDVADGSVVINDTYSTDSYILWTDYIGSSHSIQTYNTLQNHTSPTSPYTLPTISITAPAVLTYMCQMWSSTTVTISPGLLVNQSGRFVSRWNNYYANTSVTPIAMFSTSPDTSIVCNEVSVR